MAHPSTYRPKPGSIPTSPGVYRFRDKDGRVVYVGKAVNLRSRLSSYFQDVANLHVRTATMVTTAASVEWTVVGTEVEAITAARRYKPDLMIADVRLRAGDGISAVTEILRGGAVPHIFLSGDAEGVLARRPDAIVVRKPFRQSSFASAVETALKAAAVC